MTQTLPGFERMRQLSHRHYLVRQLTSAVLMLSLMGPATAEVSQIIAFGDSLSDPGNLFKLTSSLYDQGIPGDPYYNGRYSDGLLPVEVMGFLLDVKVTSYAYGGARTGMGNQGGAALNNTGVAAQVQRYAAEHEGAVTRPHTLFFVWAGPNDFYTGNNLYNAATARLASSNLLADIQTLYDSGARDFFVPLMPDLSTTPAALHSSMAFRTAAQLRTAEYNLLLSDGIAAMSQTLPGMNAIVFDVPAFMQQSLPDLIDQNFNTTEPCYDANANVVCPNEEKYLFWDDVHPSAAAAWKLGSAFTATVSVPEPSISMLTLFGLSALLCVAKGHGRRQRRVIKQSYQAASS